MAADFYELRYGQPPTSLLQLVDVEIADKHLVDIVDPWGNEYGAFVRHDGTFVVVSAGPDGDFGTDDDLHQADVM